MLYPGPCRERVFCLVGAAYTLHPEANLSFNIYIKILKTLHSRVECEAVWMIEQQYQSNRPVLNRHGTSGYQDVTEQLLFRSGV